ncbi:hypothetical protein GGE61_004691 [Rhizobium leguminosarum]|nr:hypothetical protein [Rhizobium leguminosarum]
MCPAWALSPRMLGIFYWLLLILFHNNPYLLFSNLLKLRVK